MEKLDTIQEYLAIVEEQIRWKRARPVLSGELKDHMEDQRTAFLRSGQPVELAERLTIDEMGDPVSVGAELDRVHRPKPQWGLLCLTMMITLAGGVLRVSLTASAPVIHEVIDPVRTYASVLLGCVCLVGMYFLDFTRLVRRARAVYWGAVLLGVLSLWVSPPVNGVSYYTRYIVLAYPAVFALWLCSCRKQGWAGLLRAVLGGIPLAAIALLCPFMLGAIQLLLTGFFLVMAAICMDWFGVDKKRAALDVGLVAAILGAAAGYAVTKGILQNRFHHRILFCLHPELDPLGAGYLALWSRTALANARWIGAGTWTASAPYEVILSEWNRDFLLTTVIFKLGWLPFLALIAALAGLVIWLLCRCLRQKSRAGRLVVLATILTMVWQMMTSLMLNLGWVLFGASMPLIVGNLNTLLYMGLIGLALSVFRGDSIAREIPCGRPPQKKKYRWKLVRVEV